MTIKILRKKSETLSNLNTRYGVLLEERASDLIQDRRGVLMEQVGAFYDRRIGSNIEDHSGYHKE